MPARTIVKLVAGAFIEESMRYIMDDLMRKLGITREPLAKLRTPNMIFRLIRKSFRLTILPLLTALASLAGDGESIHAVFQKKSK